ncbi:predicted protein [Mycobacterium tuberculosis T46]|nr:predicted protein [Mycobacterium tuberculosis T46]
MAVTVGLAEPAARAGPAVFALAASGPETAAQGRLAVTAEPAGTGGDSWQRRVTGAAGALGVKRWCKVAPVAHGR